jgi:hypothetical protein
VRKKYNLSYRRLRRLQHWKNLWKINPEGMLSALNKNRQKRTQMFHDDIQATREIIAESKFPMTKPQFKLWCEEWVKVMGKGRSGTGYKVATLKRYVERHNLLAFDHAAKLWRVPLASQ